MLRVAIVPYLAFLAFLAFIIVTCNHLIVIPPPGHVTNGC